jgi:cyclase
LPALGGAVSPRHAAGFFMPLTRRTVLNATLAGAASLCVPGLACAAGKKKPELTVMPLADDLLLIQGAGGNVVVATSAEGLLMVDGGSPERSAELLKLIAKQTGGRPIKTLFNTHWHWDHTGSNEAVAATGATLIAHENTKLWLGTEVISRWESRTYPARPAKALPNQTFFYGSKELSFGGRRIDYGHLPQAHTDGDVYVSFPMQSVLVAGDVVSGGSYPLVDYSTTGWLGGMINGLKTLIGLCDPGTRVVPGTGPLRSKTDLEAQLEMCFTVLTRIGQSYYKGETWAELVASRPTREFDAQWGNPDLFLRMAYEGAWQHVNEIRRVTR